MAAAGGGDDGGGQTGFQNTKKKYWVRPIARFDVFMMRYPCVHVGKFISFSILSDG